jgi:hypothetical protein
MKVRVEKSFDHDVDKVKDKKLLQKISIIISEIESAAEIKDISHVRKIKSFSSFYRIKTVNYLSKNNIYAMALKVDIMDILNPDLKRKIGKSKK